MGISLYTLIIIKNVNKFRRFIRKRGKKKKTSLKSTQTNLMGSNQTNNILFCESPASRTRVLVRLNTGSRRK